MTASSGHCRLHGEHGGDPAKHSGLAYSSRPSRADAVRDRGEESRLELAVQRAAALDVIFGSANPVEALRLLFAAGADRAGA
jgi:hypothetical protein